MIFSYIIHFCGEEGGDPRLCGIIFSYFQLVLLFALAMRTWRFGEGDRVTVPALLPFYLQHTQPNEA